MELSGSVIKYKKKGEFFFFCYDYAKNWNLTKRKIASIKAKLVALKILYLWGKHFSGMYAMNKWNGKWQFKTIIILGLFYFYLSPFSDLGENEFVGLNEEAFPPSFLGKLTKENEDIFLIKCRLAIKWK